VHLANIPVAQPGLQLLEPANRIVDSLRRALLAQEFAVNVLFADIDSENIHRFPQTAAAAISLTHASCARKAPPSIPSDLFCRKMLPVANLDYELEAQAQLGVAGSGTRPFWRLVAGFPRPRQHIRHSERRATCAAAVPVAVPRLRAFGAPLGMTRGVSATRRATT